MQLYFIIGLGGALGSILRFYLNGMVSGRFGDHFPWGTLVINATGSFLIGAFAALTGPDGRWFAHSQTRAFLMIGICGGYTTFSSFSLQTLTLVQEGEVLRAGGYIAGSVVLCLLAVWLGYALASTVNALR